MTVKEQIIRLLMSQPTQRFSGQRLSEQLAVSRNAVWKAIQDLKQNGYQIDSNNLGYQLIQTASQLDAQQIQQRWHRTEDLHVEVFDSIVSTNDYGKQYAIHQSQQLALFAATEQTAGRGRVGRTFHSQIAQGLYFSFVFSKDFLAPNVDASLITPMAALAMVQTLQPWLDGALAIKWVNDLFYKGKKVVGILTEGNLSVENGQVESYIVGIGTNLVLDEGQLAEPLQNVAGSLFDTLPKHFNRNQMITEWLMQFDKLINQPELYAQNLALYEQKMLGMNQMVTYQQQQQTKNGIIRGINSQGHLLIEDDLGNIQSLFSGEISLKSTQFIKEHN